MESQASGASTMEDEAGASERGPSVPTGRKLLVIDTTNSFELIKARGTEDSVTCRDLGGYFDHVWSVHPVASLTTSEQWTPRFGPPVEYRLDERHVFIEGKVGRYPALRHLFLLNFVVAQLGMFISLYRLIRRERISVIRAGDPLYTGLLSWALSRLARIPFVVRVGGNHDKYYETTGQMINPRLFRRRRFEKMVERFVFKRADLVAAANSDYVEFAVNNGADPQRITVFAYGNLIARCHFVDPRERRIDPALLEELGLEPGRFVMSIGRLEPLKRPQEMVRLIARLRGRGRDLKLVLVGEGTLHDETAALARELGVSDHVVFAGNRSQEWLAQVTPCAAAVLAPLAGRALSETALAATPVVAYDIDWHKDMIETGVTGELVPYRDWAAMADGVEKLLDDPDYARRAGRALRERALDMLDVDKLDAHERRQYSALLERPSRR